MLYEKTSYDRDRIGEGNVCIYIFFFVEERKKGFKFFCYSNGVTNTVSNGPTNVSVVNEEDENEDDNTKATPSKTHDKVSLLHNANGESKTGRKSSLSSNKDEDTKTNVRKTSLGASDGEMKIVVNGTDKVRRSSSSSNHSVHSNNSKNSTRKIKDSSNNKMTIAYTKAPQNDSEGEDEEELLIVSSEN